MTPPRLAWPEAAGRASVRERSQGRCELCGRAQADGVHHRQPRSAGGSWHPANLLDLCGSGTTGCHGLVEAHRDPFTGYPCDTYLMGWHVHRGEHPAGVVARLAHPVYGPGWYDLAAGDDQASLRLLEPWTPPRAGEQLPTRKWTRLVQR